MNPTEVSAQKPKRPLASQKAKAMLDSLIDHWRTQKAIAIAESEDELIAACYIDAFQTVRKNMFYETLLQGDLKKKPDADDDELPREVDEDAT